MNEKKSAKERLMEIKKRRMADAKAFNVSDFVKSSKDIREKYVKAIDRKVRYGVLTLKDSKDIMKPEDDQEKAIIILWKMLQKADPGLDLKDVEQLPLDVATAILTEISTDFLAFPQPKS